MECRKISVKKFWDESISLELISEGFSIGFPENNPRQTNEQIPLNKSLEGILDEEP